MHLLKHQNKYNTLFFALWIGMSLYLVLRTYCVDITDDEAWSYYNVKHFWWVEVLCTGNTHWFNFAAIKVALLLGCEKAWHLRWFSLLSGISFLYVAYLWIKSLDNLPVKLFAFSLLFLNPYVIEYLTLARGYSSALCFMALSLYLFSTTDEKFIVSLPLLFAGCSAIANFNFFYFFVPFTALYFHKQYFKNRFEFLKNKQFYIDGLYVLTVAFLILRALAFIKECSNDIGSFGGDDLVTSVFCNFIDTLLYGNILMPDLLKYTLGCGLAAILVSAAIYGIVTFKRHANSLYYYSSLILLSMLFLVVFNYWCFHVLYPTERTALLFYPLMIIVVVQFINHIPISKVLKKTILLLCGSLLFINFFKTAKLVGGYDHPYCKDTKYYFDDLKKLDAKNIGMSVEFYCVFYKYYQSIDPFLDGQSVNTSGVYNRWMNARSLEDFDYLLILPPYDLSYYKTSPIQLHVVKYFRNTGALIVKVEKK